MEEEDDGMIYTVAVKHHHGAPNSPMVNHMWWIQTAKASNGCRIHFPFDTFLSVSMQSSVSRSQCVKAGTEEKLVLHLLHSFAMGDSSYISIFLSTYRSFTSPKRVLDILNDRWEGFITAMDSRMKHTYRTKTHTYEQNVYLCNWMLQR